MPPRTYPVSRCCVVGLRHAGLLRPDRVREGLQVEVRGNRNDTDDMAAVGGRRDQCLEHARRVDAELRRGLGAVLRARDVRVLVHAEVDARVFGGAGRGRGAGHPPDATERRVARTAGICRDAKRPRSGDRGRTFAAGQAGDLVPAGRRPGGTDCGATSGRRSQAACSTRPSSLQTQTIQRSFPPELTDEPRNRVAAIVVQTGDHGGECRLHISTSGTGVRCAE